jgi:hypothetical protein
VRDRAGQSLLCRDVPEVLGGQRGIKETLRVVGS